MSVNPCEPYKEDGSSVTGKATATITGKRFVKISGNRTGGPALSTDLVNVYQVAQCVSGDKALGVSGYDIASGSTGKIYTRPGIILPVTSGAALTAGQEVQSDANGKAIPLAAGKALGMVLSGVAGADLDAEIKLY